MPRSSSQSSLLSEVRCLHLPPMSHGGRVIGPKPAKWLDLPSLEGIEGVVISKQVVEGTAPPLYIHADRSERTGDASA